MKKIIVLTSFAFGACQLAMAIRPGVYISTNDSNKLYQAEISQNENGSLQSLKVMQLEPIVKQIPAIYELKKMGDTNCDTSRCEHGDLLLKRAGHQGNFISYEQPLSKKSLLNLKRKNGETINFQFNGR